MFLFFIKGSIGFGGIRHDCGILIFFSHRLRFYANSRDLRLKRLLKIYCESSRFIVTKSQYLVLSFFISLSELVQTLSDSDRFKFEIDSIFLALYKWQHKFQYKAFEITVYFIPPILHLHSRSFLIASKYSSQSTTIYIPRKSL